MDLDNQLFKGCGNMSHLQCDWCHRVSNFCVCGTSVHGVSLTDSPLSASEDSAFRAFSIANQKRQALNGILTERENVFSRALAQIHGFEIVVHASNIGVLVGPTILDCSKEDDNTISFFNWELMLDSSSQCSCAGIEDCFATSFHVICVMRTEFTPSA